MPAGRELSSASPRAPLGHVCTAAVHDVFAAEEGQRSGSILVASENERIVYAPSSEMTEDMEEEGGEEEGVSDEEEAEGGSGRGGIGDDDDDDDEEEEEEEEEDEDEPGGTPTHRVKGSRSVDGLTVTV